MKSHVEADTPAMRGLADTPGSSGVCAAARWRWRLVGAVWLIVVAAGLLWSVDFDSRPGPKGQAVKAWPEGTSLAPAGDGPTLVMFLHPECPCSLASLEELDRLLGQTSPRPKTHLVFAGPEADDPTSGNVVQAGKIAGAAIFSGDGNAEAKRFGSRTSGELFVFNSAGSLEFAGGITAGRGHVGENRGSEAAAAAISGRGSSEHSMPVFGCSLFEPGEVAD